MANLKGGTLDKQVKNAFHRLESFGVKRHGANSHKTHSVALAKKRSIYLNDYKKFMESNNIEGKLNQALTSKNMDKFLSQRTENLSASTKEDYIRGWSSMLQGLQEVNISVGVDKQYFNDKVSELKKSMLPKEIPTNKAIKDIDTTIKELYSSRYESGVLAEIQYNLGFRVSEAMKLLNNPLNYIKNNKVVGMVGKGNHKYSSKSISLSLQAKIKVAKNIPSYGTYKNDISKATNSTYTPHSIRYNYALKEFNNKLKMNIPYRQILKEISQGLNHSREEMTNYYLSRA